jgi:hypothetical protein
MSQHPFPLRPSSVRDVHGYTLIERVKGGPRRGLACSLRRAEAHRAILDDGQRLGRRKPLPAGQRRLAAARLLFRQTLGALSPFRFFLFAQDLQQWQAECDAGRQRERAGPRG